MDVEKIVKGILLELNKAISKEVIKGSLQELEEDFYERVREAIRLLETSSSEGKKEANMAKSLLKKLIEVRSRKIVALALKGENIREKLTKEEKELYNNVRTIVDEFKRRVLEEKKKEVSLCVITSDLSEPVVDLQGRVLFLRKGDVLAISSEISSLFEKAGIGRKIR